jgi:RNA polymerase sigma-70 factor (ECF subfamily)
MAEGSAAPEIAQLVADYHQALYRYAYRLTGSVPDAEDLTQQVFLVAHQHFDQVRDSQRAGGWLFAVLRSCYLKLRRRRQPVPAATIDLDVNTIADDAPHEPIDSQQLQAAIDQLDDEFKLVVLLFYFEHCSYREIAERLDIPPGTVMSRLARAKAHLRRRLGEHEVPVARGTQSAVPRSALVKPVAAVRL